MNFPYKRHISSKIRRSLAKTRRIFPRINGPNDSVLKLLYIYTSTSKCISLAFNGQDGKGSLHEILGNFFQVKLD